MATFGSSKSPSKSSRLLLLLAVTLLALSSSGADAAPLLGIIGGLPIVGGLLQNLPVIGEQLFGPKRKVSAPPETLSTNLAADSALPDVRAVFPAVAAGKLETRNMLAFCIKVNLDSPARKGEGPTITITILPGQKGDVPIMAMDPTTKSRYRVSVYYHPPTPGTCKGRYTVFATNGPPSARVVAAAGYRTVLPGFCTGGDVKEITGLIVSGFADPQGTDTNVRTQFESGFECAKKISSGQDP